MFHCIILPGSVFSSCLLLNPLLYTIDRLLAPAPAHFASADRTTPTVFQRLFTSRCVGGSTSPPHVVLVVIGHPAMRRRNTFLCGNLRALDIDRMCEYCTCVRLVSGLGSVCPRLNVRDVLSLVWRLVVTEAHGHQRSLSPRPNTLVAHARHEKENCIALWASKPRTLGRCSTGDWIDMTARIPLVHWRTMRYNLQPLILTHYVSAEDV